MNTAFVASTLPALFLKKNAEKLGIGKIVCSRDELVMSYEFVMQGHKDVIVEAAPDAKARQFLFLTRHLMLCEKAFFSHECCWPLFDIALILIRRDSVWFPQSSMQGFRLLPSQNISVKGQIRFFYSNEKKIRPLRAVSVSLLKKWFDVYETEKDGGVGFDQCLSLKTEKFHFIQTLLETYDGNLCQESVDLVTKTHKVLFACAREPIADSVQIKLYSELAFLLTQQGYDIHIKDHPNQGARLGLDYAGAKKYPDWLPIECIDEKFDFVIGVASASLARLNCRSISLINLLPFSPEIIESRLRTLRSFSNFPRILFVNSFQEIRNIITEL